MSPVHAKGSKFGLVTKGSLGAKKSTTIFLMGFTINLSTSNAIYPRSYRLLVTQIIGLIYCQLSHISHVIKSITSQYGLLTDEAKLHTCLDYIDSKLVWGHPENNRLPLSILLAWLVAPFLFQKRIFFFLAVVLKLLILNSNALYVKYCNVHFKVEWWYKLHYLT